MRSHIIFKILLIILLMLLAAPLLGALVMMVTGGSSAIIQMPNVMNGRMMGLAMTWIALILLLIVTAIVWVVRTIGSKRGKEEQDKAA
jgi:cytochrome oxidase assembly protein ShyY1